MPLIDTENLNKILDYWFKQNGKVHKKDKLLEYIVKRIYLTVYQKEKDPKSPSKDKSLRTGAIEAYKKLGNNIISKNAKLIAEAYKNLTENKEIDSNLDTVLKKFLNQVLIAKYIEKNNINYHQK